MLRYTLFFYFMVIAILPIARSAVVNPKPTTCAAVRSIYHVSQNGYFTLHDSTNKPYLAFCDFQSDPGFAWTLIESLSRTNAATTTFRKSFYYNVPSNECTPNWSNYRLSKAKMSALKQAASSTHFRATCNFDNQNEKGLANRRDYIRVSFCAYNSFFSARNAWICAVVDYINIRGYSCSKCNIPFYSYSNYHLFVDLPQAKVSCGRFNVPDVKSGEDIFGNYVHYHPKFSCTMNSTSTTNWWIGGAFYD
ncbi:uncharacterized protein TRIADDRAFT_63826 [Trichoplax adhaerens]|uniref:Fibrinogen C-terminal domain-containing protein n=1 Tax=Trichoplax adhaerens TaxID=10228 RepID=B3RUF3_TRIAD|nr:predicted protein [Trichoplax adhaerens]EDV25804.1 predicted protein [Trichoplax adhaerens]|eukprot:XP_002111837.1 predicted protein [Trichoplax adhaerens]